MKFWNEIRKVAMAFSKRWKGLFLTVLRKSGGNTNLDTNGLNTCVVPGVLFRRCILGDKLV